jgi:hypothetical protein
MGFMKASWAERVQVFGGVTGFLLLAAFIVVGEHLAVALGRDYATPAWIILHYVVNPALCFLYLVVTVIKGLYGSSRLKPLYPLGMLVAMWYLLIAFVGSAKWPELIGLTVWT